MRFHLIRSADAGESELSELLLSGAKNAFAGVMAGPRTLYTLTLSAVTLTLDEDYDEATRVQVCQIPQPEEPKAKSQARPKASITTKQRSMRDQVLQLPLVHRLPVLLLPLVLHPRHQQQ